jgi:hypothetical protein
MSIIYRFVIRQTAVSRKVLNPIRCIHSNHGNQYPAAAAAGISTMPPSSPLTRQKEADHSFCSKLCILGGGQMCEAILGALYIKGIQKSHDIVVVDTHEKRLDYLAQKYNVQVSTNADFGIKNAELVILSVKPQNVKSLAATIHNPPSGLLLSIVAGLPIDEIKRYFKTDRVIRSMPNTPAMVLEGITVWLATSETPLELVDKARTLLNTFGDQIQVTDEQYIDMATAVSGSGPAVSHDQSSTFNLFLFNLSLLFSTSYFLLVCFPCNGSHDRCCCSFRFSSRYGY